MARKRTHQPDPAALRAIDDLQVIPPEQNTRYGRAMLADMADDARHQGCRTIRLRVFDDNPARRLYEVIGFTEKERDGDAA